jgi:hypothetical protein
MCLKIRCDGESEKFCNFFCKLNQPLGWLAACLTCSERTAPPLITSCLRRTWRYTPTSKCKPAAMHDARQSLHVARPCVTACESPDHTPSHVTLKVIRSSCYCYRDDVTLLRPLAICVYISISILCTIYLHLKRLCHGLLVIPSPTYPIRDHISDPGLV